MGRVAIVIPARYGSTRFPGKPLAEVRGPDGVCRPAIFYSWVAARKAVDALGGEVDCVVATDDQRIFDACRAMDIAAMMTPADCSNGTERCAAAIAGSTDTPAVVINLQGDAPLTPPDMVVAVADLLRARDELTMTTAVVPASDEMLLHLQADAEAGRAGATTVACTREGRALYFSKAIIPHGTASRGPNAGVLIHVGLYAYRPDALRAYVEAGPAPIELREGLEQLRFLDAGMPIGLAFCDPPGWDMIELNNPEDVPLIEDQLKCRARLET